MKVLYARMPNEHRGDRELHSQSARALKPLGIQVGIATTGGPLVSKCRTLGIPIHLLSVIGWRERISLRLSAIIKTYRYQLVHANDTISYRLAAWMHRQLGIPVIMTVHGVFHGIPALKEAAKIARCIITVSPAPWTI